MLGEITKANIRKFWNELAAADLGTAVHWRAQEIADFFNELLGDDGYTPLPSDGNIYETEYTASGFERDSRMAAILHGFQMATGYYADAGLSISICADLHSVTMSESVVIEFQRHVMSLTPDPPAFDSDVVMNWLWRYQNLHTDDAKPRKRRSRKTA